MAVNLILLVKQLTSKKIHNPSLDYIKRRCLGARAAQGDGYHQFFRRDDFRLRNRAWKSEV